MKNILFGKIFKDLWHAMAQVLALLDKDQKSNSHEISH